MARKYQKNSIEPDYYVVEFKNRRIDYFIERNHLGLEPGEWVIVQAERGKDMGRVLFKLTRENFERHSEHKYPLEILRRATPEEIEYRKQLYEMEKEVLRTCQEYVDFRGLGMKLVDAEYQFDRNKLTIYFTADGRVDFRELVKDLAATYRTRIELRQIGVRDEAKKLGGLGPCGRPLCCATFLHRFEPITTQMARAQHLVVNPSKISGLCERLMCCLAYEMDFYEKVAETYPEVGSTVKFEDGSEYVVEAVDYFKEKITLRHPETDDRIVLGLIEYRKRLAGRKDFLKKWVSHRAQNSRD